MKVLHIGNISSVGYLLCQGLRAKGVEADLISKDNKLFSVSQKDPWVTYVNSPVEELSLAYRRLENYDLIHAHYLLNFGTTGLRIKSPNVPVILHCHGSDTRPANLAEKALQRFNASMARKLLFSTPDLWENIQWFKGEKIYLPNPVEMTGGSYAPCAEKHILIHTVLNRVKRTEKLFMLIKDLPYLFDIISYGPDKEHYRRIAPANVRFIDPVEKARVPELLRRYSLILGGSMDGTLRVCELEAMAQGVPALFPFKYYSFYDQLLPMPELNSNNILRYDGSSELGSRQKAWVEKFHGLDAVVSKLIDIYRREVS